MTQYVSVHLDLLLGRPATFLGFHSNNHHDHRSHMWSCTIIGCFDITVARKVHLLFVSVIVSYESESLGERSTRPDISGGV